VPLVDNVPIEISVVLGSATMPIHQLLRLGRGAVIELGVTEDTQVTVLANEHPIAKGAVIVSGNRISVSIKSFLRGQESSTAIEVD
jgi:flagellar motor switch protein FliN/FliY